MPHPIAGVLPVVHTPLRDDDTIDFESVERLVDWAFAQSADGYCTGMVSELLRLTCDERLELTRRLASGPRAPNRRFSMPGVPRNRGVTP
jgi:4-hydroxy-tetrahydrodipicolinate synthase